MYILYATVQHMIMLKHEVFNISRQRKYPPYAWMLRKPYKFYFWNSILEIISHKFNYWYLGNSKDNLTFAWGMYI